jgi:Tfp pilus assembly protein PilN
MSQVNLLPPEIRQSQRVRKVTVGVLLAGAVLALGVFGFFVLQSQRLAGVEDDIAAQEDANAQIQTQIDELQEFEDLQVEAQRKQALVGAAYAGEVSMSGMLQDLSDITPDTSYLTSFSVALEAAVEGQETGFIGTIQIGAISSNVETMSTWLQRIEQVEGWVNPWIPSYSRDEADDVTFSIGVDMTDRAQTERGSAGGGGGGA